VAGLDDAWCFAELWDELALEEAGDTGLQWVGLSASGGDLKAAGERQVVGPGEEGRGCDGLEGGEGRGGREPLVKVVEGVVDIARFAVGSGVGGDTVEDGLEFGRCAGVVEQRAPSAGAESCEMRGGAEDAWG
jgi:hypothetical protein